MIPPYPLQWPDDLPRSAKREPSKFRTTLVSAMNNVQDSLRLFGQDSGRKVTEVVISSNAVLGDMRPVDPGVAVWFTWDESQHCIAVDRYAKVECNLQAIHHVFEARRVELRHAGIQMVRATFRGLRAALPAPGSEHWTVALGLPRTATIEDVQAAWREKVRLAPNENARSRYNVARDQARQELA